MAGNMTGKGGRRLTGFQGAVVGMIAGWVFLMGLAAGLGKLDNGLLIAGFAGAIGLTLLLPLADVKRDSPRACPERASR